MIRLADILKKYKDGGKYHEPFEPPSQQQAKVPPEPAQVSVSTAVGKEMTAAISARANEIYLEAFVKAKEVYRLDPEHVPALSRTVGLISEKIIDALSGGNRELIRATLIDYAKTEEYVVAHAVNVWILATDIGIGAKLDHKALLELGQAALLHDVGVMNFLTLINKNGILTKQEFDMVKTHPQKSAEMLQRTGIECSRAVIDAVEQEHERVDGSGYPKGFKENAVCLFAQIIGLVDMYEAMIHYRPYRAKYSTLETIKTILSHKSAFDNKWTKILIERIGIFPVGIMVRLNTKELAMVIRDNPKLPLRPVVEILFDGTGQQLKESRQLDLARNPVVFIEECMESLHR